MPLLACRDHTARIAAVESQIAALIKLTEGTLGITTGIIESMKDRQPPGPDPDLPGYHG